MCTQISFGYGVCISGNECRFSLNMRKTTVLVLSILRAGTIVLTLMLIETLRILALDCFLRCASLCPSVIIRLLSRDRPFSLAALPPAPSQASPLLDRGPVRSVPEPRERRCEKRNQKLRDAPLLNSNLLFTGYTTYPGASVFFKLCSCPPHVNLSKSQKNVPQTDNKNSLPPPHPQTSQ